MSSILALCFFPAFNPAASGGELRLRNFYRAVSQDHDVTLLTSTHFGARFEEIDHTPRFRELRFPKDDSWRNAYATLEQSGLRGDLAGLAFALAVTDVRCPLRICARELAKTCDFVIHECPYSEPMFNDDFECTEIYNSHNFEIGLLSSTVSGEGIDSAILKLIRLEGNLISRCHRVFATSSEDAEKFRLFYDADSVKLSVCTNRLDEMHVTECDSWTHVASDFSRALEHISSSNESQAEGGTNRPVVLALNDYSIIQLRSGGATRVRQLLSHIDCDVVLISFGATFEVCSLGRGFIHITVPKTSVHQLLESAANSDQPVSVNDAVASLFVAGNRVLSSLVAALVPRIGAVILEHPYMAPALDAIAAARPELPIVYSAHNVERSHKAAILRFHALGASLQEFIAALERRLAVDADLIVCCTDSDALFFRELNSNVLVVPNGCTIPEHFSVAELHEKPAAQSIASIGFLGSAHSPNVEAARFIVDELAMAFPTGQFELVGGVCSALTGEKPANVILHGEVGDEQKTSILRKWDIALNPVLLGGGSSLKLPDYLAHGLATLNTPEGARGFSIAEHKAGRLASRSEFPAVITDMLNHRESLAEVRKNAFRYAAEQLNWSVVTLPYRQRLQHLLASRVPSPGDTRLLVVTHRYTEPPLGGEEEYLIEVVKQLRRHFGRIDLAAIDTGQLTDRHHFGCAVQSLEGGASLRMGELFDHACYFPPDIVPDVEQFMLSRELERQWCQEEVALLGAFATRLAEFGNLRVFTGFYDPEVIDRARRRWTAPEFSFLVPASARSFQMSGSIPRANTLYMTIKRLLPDGQTELLDRSEMFLSATFDVAIPLSAASGDAPLILSFQIAEYLESGDHRPLGVLLEKASVVINRNGMGVGFGNGANARETLRADLQDIPEEELRAKHLKDWVRTLRDNALSRDADAEAAFAAVRGPHSSALQAWLARQSANYDMVLVQGLPFDVVPSTVETIADVPNRPRLAILPHFHSDDRFYHWRRYFRAFSRADVTLLFSSSIVQQLALDGRFSVVSGSGVRCEEFLDVSATHRFRQVHGNSEPFFLVLDRKVDSKAYHRVIQAQQALRRAGVRVSMVMIGTDEDKVLVSRDGLYFLGHQPRGVVRGALRCCLALVTMSSSDSSSNAICEAWLFGKPVIANRACGAFQEMVRHAETGLLVTTDPELERAMRLLVERSDDRLRMGRNGFDVVMKSYTWEKAGQEFLSALPAQCEELRQVNDKTPLQGVPL